VAGETELPRARCLNLRLLIPDVNTALFICCNSTVARSHDASPTRRPARSLYRSTGLARYACRYRNVFALAPTIDVGRSKRNLTATRR